MVLRIWLLCVTGPYCSASVSASVSVQGASVSVSVSVQGVSASASVSSSSVLSEIQYSGEEGDDSDDVGVDGGTGIGNVLDPDPSVVAGELAVGGEGVGR